MLLFRIDLTHDLLFITSELFLYAGFRLVPENTTKFALGGTAPCMCESKDQAASYAWYFRGVLRLSSVPGLNLYTEGNTAVMEVELLEEWDSSIVYCQARMLNGVWLTSPEAMIQIQGSLTFLKQTI